MSTGARAALAKARRVVVKIGSRSIVGASLHEGAREGGGRFEAFAAQLAALRGQGCSVVVVSSGAVALGRGQLGFVEKPKSIAQLQACAAVGQSLLMRGWERALATHELTVGQMLLSHADLEDRARYLNARNALDALIDLDAVPIINENDTVAVDEIRFGDNDQLAAMVSTLASADLLVLLTDVAGLLDGDGARVSVVDDIDAALTHVAPGAVRPEQGDGARAESGTESGRREVGADVGSGGMASKLEAARRASRRGVPVIIADAGARNVLASVLAGEDVGTLVVPRGGKITSRKHWIAYTLRSRGDLILDTGAVEAIRAGGRSLLPAGLVGVRGSFAPGDAVVLRGVDGREIARGLTRYGTEDAAKLAGARTHEIMARLGYHGGDELVHRDDLALTADPG